MDPHVTLLVVIGDKMEQPSETVEMCQSKLKGRAKTLILQTTPAMVTSQYGDRFSAQRKTKN
jgi:hypothetical protein